MGLVEAAQDFALAFRCDVPLALRWIGYRVRTGKLRVFRLQQPPATARPAGNNEVWIPASQPSATDPLHAETGHGAHVGHLGFEELIRRTAHAPNALADLGLAVSQAQYVGHLTPANAAELLGQCPKLKAYLAACAGGSGTQASGSATVPLFAKGPNDERVNLIALETIRQQLARHMPTRAAAHEVAQRVVSAGVTAYCNADAIGWLVPVLDSDCFIEDQPPGRHTWWVHGAHVPRAMVAHEGNMLPGEAVRRGVKLNPAGERWIAHLTEEQWQELPPFAAQYGLAGALALVKLLNMPGATISAPDLAQRVACLSIAEADALSLFLELAPVQVVPINQSAAQTKDLNALGQRIKAHQAAPKNPNGRGFVDEAAALALLLQQYDDRMEYPGANMLVAEEALSELWGLTQNTIHSYLGKARAKKTLPKPGVKRHRT
jgi:hypothetical protein